MISYYEFDRYLSYKIILNILHFGSDSRRGVGWGKKLRIKGFDFGYGSDLVGEKKYGSDP